MDPEPLRQILDRQLKRIRKAADTEDTNAGRETGCGWPSAHGG